MTQDLESTNASAQTAHDEPFSAGELLTQRELEVLALMGHGLTNKEIAQRLAISRRTVETHIHHLLDKLGATTRTRAVVEAGRLGLLEAAAPARMSVSQKNNLPIQLTALSGRTEELAVVQALLDGSRLLTLSGSGGVGKTRIAVRVGLDRLDRHRDGVWFLDLSPLTDPSLVPAVVAKTLATRDVLRATPTESIVNNLANAQSLLIFDNCEHVLESAAALIDEILRRCPGVSIIATSRQSLGVESEVVHRVPSLSVPENVAVLDAEQAATFGAVEMFVDRARASDTRFALTDENVAAVAEICIRLDGIPLAIELAASRTNTLDVHSLARKLGDRFSLLTGGARTALPRHKTLTALIDWSYDHLSADERRLLNRLGVFCGFTLDAATAVCGGEGLNSDDFVDLVAALVDKSLVAVEAGPRGERFRLLETTKAYVLEELAIAGEGQLLARRHADYFLQQAIQADERYGYGSAAVWLATVELDIENYRAAMRWGLSARNDIATGAAIAGHLERLWFLGGLAGEARAWVALGLESIDEERQPAIAARLWRARARFMQGEPMRASAERALKLYERVGDMRGVAYSLRMLAYSLLQTGSTDEAHRVIERAVAAFRERGDKVGIASCLGLLGVSAYAQGDLAAGRRHYIQAVAACREIGDELATADVLGNFGELEFADGHPERALRLVTESLEITSRGKEVANLAIDHNNRAAYCVALGRLEDARESAQAGLRCARGERNEWNTYVALQHLALLKAISGGATSAANILGYVNAQYERLALEREATEKWAYMRLLEELRKRLSPIEFDELLVEGSAWSEDMAVEAALTP
ncbi:MAG TPA: LuxR C-terminal-related transcriptional regulator [Candidatus Eremiobacteraceae bacterium]|nr:LuxR C-terminal-related transcriptional regulator [Candidatus Eremiobacteraceae bacterium]